jgi:hypothetical protein
MKEVYKRQDKGTRDMRQETIGKTRDNAKDKRRKRDIRR